MRWHVPRDARTLAMFSCVSHGPLNRCHGVACSLYSSEPHPRAGMSPMTLAMGWHVPHIPQNPVCHISHTTTSNPLTNPKKTPKH